MAAAVPRRSVALSVLPLVFLVSVAQAQIHRRAVTVVSAPNATSTETAVNLMFDPATLTGIDPNGQNLWVIADDQQTVVPHYVESWTPTAAQVWFRIPRIPANTSKTYYLMYGNPSQGVSDFAATFPSRYILTSGNVTLTGNQNYDWFEIRPGATITVQAEALLAINATRVRIDGWVDARGRGHPGPASLYTIGAGPGAGSALSAQGSGGAGYGGSGGGGGSNSFPPAAGGLAYGTSKGADIALGSSGASADGKGGNGGGAVKITARAVAVTGTIDARGGNADPAFFGFGGGGGSGGGVLLNAHQVEAGPGGIRVDGGGGADVGGGGGGGGRIKVHCEAFALEESTPPAFTVAGGAPGYGGTSLPPVPGAAGTWFIGTHAEAGIPNTWLSVSIGPEEGVVDVETNGLRQAFVGMPAPNPSRHDVSFRMEFVREERCRVAILDLQGRRVRSLLDGTLTAGAREISWDLRDEQGLAVPGGLYFANVEIDGARWTRRIVIAR